LKSSRMGDVRAKRRRADSGTPRSTANHAEPRRFALTGVTSAAINTIN